MTQTRACLPTLAASAKTKRYLTGGVKKPRAQMLSTTPWELNVYSDSCARTHRCLWSRCAFFHHHSKTTPPPSASSNSGSWLEPWPHESGAEITSSACRCALWEARIAPAATRVCLSVPSTLRVPAAWDHVDMRQAAENKTSGGGGLCTQSTPARMFNRQG